MKKEFNITGLCIKDRHYMVDTTDKINEILDMVESGKYFAINRPRQYGKTTTLNTLYDVLYSKGYLVISTSFEGVGDNLFSSESEFCSNVLELFATSIEMVDSNTADLILKHSENISTFQGLSRAIMRIVKESQKKMVLLTK